MKSIAIKDLSENFFEVIGKEWMLVTAGSKEHFNTMTASWGGIGWLWNKPVVFVFIRSERYTYEFMEENEYFTLSFLGKENRSIYNLCGSKSGREVDKVKETGLNPIVTERGNILFEQDRLGLECRKLFITDMKEELFLDHSVYERWYVFEQDRLGLECRKLFITDMKEELFLDHSVYERWYGGDHGGLHRVYVAEIVDAWVKE